MRYNLRSTFVLTALLLLFPVAHGQLVSPLVIDLNLTGTLTCPPSGPGSPPGPGLAGEVASLNCGVGRLNVTIAQLITGPNGHFDFSIPNISLPLPLKELFDFNVPNISPALPLDGLLPCTVDIDLPLDDIECQVLSDIQGTLSAAVATVRAVVDEFEGLIVNAIAGPFVVNVRG